MLRSCMRNMINPAKINPTTENLDSGECSTPHESDEILQKYRECLLVQANLGPIIVAQANDMFRGDLLTLKNLTEEKLNQKFLNDYTNSETKDPIEAYKQALMEQIKLNPTIVEPDNPRPIIVKRMALLVERRPEFFLDLTEDVTKLKNTPFIIKEGTPYRMRLEFIVQRQIINRLYYEQKIKRMGFITVTEKQQMVGSYSPKEEIQHFITFSECAPKGPFARRTYKVHSSFRDSKNNQLFKWEWSFKIVKDWKD